MSIDEQIEVLKACKEGKTIQIRDKGSDGDWDNILFSDNENVNWDFCNYEYRVKPEENPDPMTIKMLTEWLAKRKRTCIQDRCQRPILPRLLRLLCFGWRSSDRTVLQGAEIRHWRDTHADKGALLQGLQS